MIPTSDCPPRSVLGSIATGGIREPLLGVYLDHLERCDACCSEIERHVDAMPRASRQGDGKSFPVGPTAGRVDRLAEWLEALKRETPVENGDEDRVIGTRIGPFRIAAILGEGASSVVYEAIDEDLGRRVVLKVWRSAHCEDYERRRMIVAEARALAAVQHEAIMPLLQLLWFEDMPVLVFPRLPGETLADALAAESLTWRDGLDVVRQVARGLGHAHALGICHQDVKPSNIWIHRRPGDSRASALLFDFGLAGTGGASFGTPGYSEPVGESPHSQESRDLFSLGVVLHECMARVPDAPSECRSLVRRLTAEPAGRRPDALAVAADIDRLLQPPGRRWWTAVATACSAVVALSVVGMLSLPGWAPVAMRRSTERRPLFPEAIVSSRGLPVAFSSDGTVQCSVEEGPSLRVWNLEKNESLASIPLTFRPDHLLCAPDRRYVAVGNRSGDVGIVDVLHSRMVQSHHFPDGVAWIGWAGWRRQVLAVLSGDEVHGFFFHQDRSSPPDAIRACTLVTRIRDDVTKIASCPVTDALVSLDGEGRVTIWSVGNLTPDSVLPFQITGSPDPVDIDVGWKNPGVCFVESGGRIFEFAGAYALRHYDVLAPVDDILWMTESEYVLLSGRKDGRPELRLGDQRRPGWRRECDLEDEPVESIQLLDDQRRVIAITRSGGGRVYRVGP